MMSYMTVLSVNIMRNNVLLIALFISSALAACPEDSALFITSPTNMEALSGSCLQIPCNFSDRGAQFDSSKTIVGVWIKKDLSFTTFPENIIFNSSKTDNLYPMDITGNLNQRDCTTLFSNLNTSYSDIYFFRIENDQLKATAICDPPRITITDSPPSPRIDIPDDLKEKESVTITCSAATPCPHSPPELTWNLQDSHSTTEENTDRTLTTKIQKTITLSDTHDGNIITCSASYPVNDRKDVKTAATEVTLNVSYAPKETSASISPTGSVSAGSRVNLTCSSRAKPPVSSFTWFKSSKDGPVEVSEGDFYSFNVTDSTDGGVYYCVATNDLGNQTAEILLIVEGEEPGSSLQWEPILGGIIGVILLICLIVYVWWLKSKHKTQQQTQRETPEEPARKTEEGEENIHYGEIKFSKRRPEPSSDSVQASRQQEDTVYAQVNVNKPANSLTDTADGPEQLYAQVRKK